MENLFRYFTTIYDTSLHETLFSTENEIEYVICATLPTSIVEIWNLPTDKYVINI